MPGEKFQVGLVIKAFDQVTAPLKKINDRLNQFQAPLRTLNNRFRGLAEASGLKALGTSIGNVGSSVNRLGASVFSLGTKFVLFGGIAAAGLGKIVNGAVESSSKLVDLSDATGASIDSIQRLGFAWQQSGGNAEDFEGGLKKFSIALGLARKNTGPLVEGLKKIDPKLFKELLGKKDTGDAFRVFIKGLSKAKTDAFRLALATKVVGKSANMAAAILGKAGTENLKLLEMETPGVISDDEARKAEAFGDTLNKLKVRTGGLLTAIATPFLPVFDEIGKSFDKIFKDKEPEIRAFAKEFADKLPGRITKVGRALRDLWEALRPLRQAFAWIIADSGRVKIALGVLAAFMARDVIFSTLKLGSALVGLAFNFGRVAFSAGVLLAPLAKVVGVLGIGVAWFAAITVAASLAGRAIGAAIWDQAGTSANNFLQVLEKIWNALKLLSGVTLLQGLFKGDIGGEFKDTFSNLIKPFDLQAPKQFSQLWGEALRSVGEDAKNVGQMIPGMNAAGATAGPIGFLKKKSPFQQSSFFSPPSAPAELPSADLGARAVLTKVVRQETTQKAQINVKFDDLPRGARVTAEKNPKLAINLDLGYAMEAV